MSNFITNPDLFFTPKYDESMYYRNTNIFEYSWRRLMTGSHLNVRELLEDSTNITFSKYMPISRFMEIINTLRSNFGELEFGVKDESDSAASDGKCELTWDDLFGEDAYLTPEELANSEYVPIEEGESVELEDDSDIDNNDRVVWDIGCSQNGLLRNANFNYITLAEFKAAYEFSDEEQDIFDHLDFGGEDLFEDCDEDEDYGEYFDCADDEELIRQIDELYGDEDDEEDFEDYENDEELLSQLDELYGDEDDEDYDDDEELLSQIDELYGDEEDDDEDYENDEELLKQIDELYGDDDD